MTDLKRPIAELVMHVRTGKLSAVALVEASLARIAATTEYHAVLELNPDARHQAEVVDARVKAGEDLPLAGIPFSAKDLFLTRGTHTTAASNILKSFEAPYEGPVIQRLQAAGAVLVAKTNLDAFAHGTSTENSDFGPTKNPFDLTRVAGGSSGGSTASVALGQVSFSLGTDTGGSIRLPASFCGVVGLKPTYGLVPRSGVIAMGSSFDCVGPITNSVEDAGLVLDILAGSDPSDATTIERDSAGYQVTPASLKDVKIGVIKEYLGEGLNSKVKSRLQEVLASLTVAGAQLQEVSLPTTGLALGAYYVLVPAEVSSNLARYDGVKYGYRSPQATTLEETYRLSREEGFGSEAKRRIMIGTYVLSSGYYDAYYKRAQKVRTKLIAEFAAAFDKYDLLVGPTAPAPAFLLGSKTKDPLAMYLEDIMTVAVNLAGCPAISIPIGKLDSLPYGMQFIAPQRGERKLLAAAASGAEIIGDWSKR
jgi:aspartyl-tRNA(Asn)/glutamyl-tRNA(Gln) amidotransferase subunit A